MKFVKFLKESYMSLSIELLMKDMRIVTNLVEIYTFCSNVTTLILIRIIKISIYLFIIIFIL